jgi:hypothetical protein
MKTPWHHRRETMEAQQSAEASEPVPETPAAPDLWATRGLDDVYYQRETQVTYWSILGGIAVGALLSQFFPLLQQIQTSRWYLVLYFLTSVFFLINAWVQASWGALVLTWRINFPITFLYSLATISQAVMCLLVTDPAGWSMAVACALFFNQLLQLQFQKRGGWQRFSPEALQDIRQTLRVYTTAALISLAVAILLFMRPSRPVEIAWGFIGLLVSVLAMFMQHYGMERQRKELGIP